MKMLERSAWLLALSVVAIWGARGGGSPEGAGGEVPPSKTASRSQVNPGPERAHDRFPDRKTVGGSGIKGRLARSLRRQNPLERTADFLAVLSACDRRNIGELEAAWKELKATGVDLPAEEMLLNQRLGQLKGAEALAGCTGRAEDFAAIDLLKSRFDGWLLTDSYGAKAWLEELPAGKFRDQMALRVIAASASGDPVAALDQVSMLPEQLRQTAGRAAGERLRESLPLEEGSRLLADLAAMGDAADEKYLEGLFGSLAEAAGNSGGEAMSQLVESHLDQAYVSSRTLAQVSVEKGKSDPLSALDWAAGVEGKKHGLSEGSLLSAAVEGMRLDDLDRAEEWAKKRPDWPGIARMQATLDLRRRLLEDRGDDANEYDKDD